MAHISPKEILDIARLSMITVHKDEEAALCNQVIQILEYAQMVQHIANEQAHFPAGIPKQSNVFREDVAIYTDAVPLLAEAPNHEGNYFVVPLILDSNE